jgi:ureidoglycolate lyase
MDLHRLKTEALTKEAFAPFGDVIQVAEAKRHFTINQGWAERYHDLAAIDVLGDGGRPMLGIVRAEPRPLPLRLRIMERHPRGSQAFVPLRACSFLVVVAPPGNTPLAEDFRCFRTIPGQGVNYAKGVWHHPLIALKHSTDFLVVDRGGEGANCDEVFYDDQQIWLET